MIQGEEPRRVPPGAGPPSGNTGQPLSPGTGGSPWPALPPGAGGAPRPEGLAVSALVLAVMALLVPVLPGIVALMLAAAAARRARALPAGAVGGRGLVAVASALSIIGVLAWVGLGALVITQRHEPAGWHAATTAQTARVGQFSQVTVPPTTKPPPLNRSEQAFVAHMRTHYNFAGVADSDIATFGTSVCTGRQAGQSQANVTSGAKSQWTHTSASDAYTMTRLAEADMCPAYLPKKTRHTIARFTGRGDTNTARFTIRGNGNWALRYSYDCSAQPGRFGNFFIDEDAMNNDNPSAVAVDRLGRGGHGSWHVHGDAGRHYLAIQTGCSYTITMSQKY